MHLKFAAHILHIGQINYQPIKDDDILRISWICTITIKRFTLFIPECPTLPLAESVCALSTELKLVCQAVEK